MNIRFEVNNNGTMTLRQVGWDGPIRVKVVRRGRTADEFEVPARDMVLLLDWFLYAKALHLPLFPEQPERIGGPKQ